jgi:hypothetical protein
MNDKDIEQICDALNEKLKAEVEIRCHEWLEAAKGTDWTRIFETTIRDKNNLLESLKETIETIHWEFCATNGHHELCLKPTRVVNFYDKDWKVVPENNEYVCKNCGTKYKFHGPKRLDHAGLCSACY